MFNNTHPKKKREKKTYAHTQRHEKEQKEVHFFVVKLIIAAEGHNVHQW